MKEFLLIIEQDPEDLWFVMPFGVKGPFWYDFKIYFEDGLSNRFNSVLDIHKRNVLTEHFKHSKFGMLHLFSNVK